MIGTYSSGERIAAFHGRNPNGKEEPPWKGTSQASGTPQIVRTPGLLPTASSGHVLARLKRRAA